MHRPTYLPNAMFAASLLLFAPMSIAHADESSPPAQPTTAQSENLPAETENTAQKSTGEEDSDNKVVCKKEPPPVGTRMGGRKVCRTVAEWRRIAAVARETTEEIQGSKVPEPAS